MFEKVNPEHPDKVADRIAGAIVDYAYKLDSNPKIAVEVLLGHKRCCIIMENSVNEIIEEKIIKNIIKRICPEIADIILVNKGQDKILNKNQEETIKCGDNGIFKGLPVTREQKALKNIAEKIYKEFKKDGKYILDQKKDKLIICQSNAKENDLKKYNIYGNTIINPLGYWSGGTDVDAGATNRKLGSDMGNAVTGGGLHGKDLSKADVSVNIYAHLKAQKTNKEVNICCAIGDEYIDGKPYSEIVEIARNYIEEKGGFEKFAEWGLI